MEIQSLLLKTGVFFSKCIETLRSNRNYLHYNSQERRSRCQGWTIRQVYLDHLLRWTALVGLRNSRAIRKEQFGPASLIDRVCLLESYFPWKHWIAVGLATIWTLFRAIENVGHCVGLWTSVKINKEILNKAASALYHDLGSLGDFPIDLRNTIGSLYYAYWWSLTTDDSSSGHPSWAKHHVIRMFHYEMLPTLVNQMREVRREHESLFEMMVGTTRDLLRFNLKNVVRKSAAWRAIEKAFKKPYYEVPGIYSLIEQEFRNLKLDNSISVDDAEGLSQGAIHDQEESEQVGYQSLPKSELDLKFLSELPHPDHSRVVKAFQHHQFSITCYRNPKSFGEIVAGIPTIYKYPHVAVIKEHSEPKLMIRTEESFDGTIYICSLSSNGRLHRNFGVFPHGDTASFLHRVVEEVSKLDISKENRPKDGSADRVIINCPSCNSALRVPRGKSGNVRCKACGELFETRT